MGDPTGRGSLRLVLFGDWLTRRGVPSAERVHAELKGDAVTSVRLDTARLGAWDTAFLTFLRKLERLTAADGPKLDTSSLPEGATRLLGLAASVPERAGARKAAARPPLLERVGKGTQAFLEACGETLAFIGEVVIAFGRLVRGRARFRWSDFFEVVQEVGAKALPIDQAAGKECRGQPASQREERAAEGGEDGAEEQEPARAEAVDQHAQRNLQGGVGVEVGGRERAEQRRVESKGGHQVVDDDRRCDTLEEAVGVAAGRDRPDQPRPALA